MGLSFGPNYTWTDHFAQRALERFEVSSEQLSKWVGRQLGSLVEYNKNDEQRPEEKKYVSQIGVVFVCKKQFLLKLCKRIDKIFMRIISQFCFLFFLK